MNDYPQQVSYPETAANSTSTSMYSITVEPLNKGYILTVGCQRIAVTSKDDLKQYLSMYIDDPKQTAEDYFAGKIKGL